MKLRGILEIARALGGQLEVDAVLPKLLSTLFNIFPVADQGFVLLKDSDSDKLKVKATQARGGKQADAVAVSMTVVRYVMKTGESVLSENIMDDTRFKSSTSLGRMGVRSMMCVPLLDENEESLGVIQIVSRSENHSFDENDLDLLESLAMQASLTIQNARLHEEALERRAIERDLEFATQVQLGFLPKSRPKVPGYLFGDYYEAALRVGGRLLRLHPPARWPAGDHHRGRGGQGDARSALDGSAVFVDAAATPDFERVQPKPSVA